MPRRRSTLQYAAALTFALTGSAVPEGQPPVRRPPSLGPPSAQAYRLLTDAYAARRVDDYDAAIAGFVAALALTPARNDVRKDLAYTYFRVGDNELARRALEDVVRRDSADAWAALELAFLDYESTNTGQKADAYRLFRRLRQSSDSTVRARAVRAFTGLDAALEVREREWSVAVAKDPSNAFYAIQRGQAAEERDRADTAEAYYARALGSSGFEALWLDVARVRRRLGRTAAADSALARAAGSPNVFVAATARDSIVRRTMPRRVAADAIIPAAGPPSAPARGALSYDVVGGDGAWPAVLGAVGYQRTTAARARILVVRSGADPAAMDWQTLVRDGAVLVLEGPSRVAELFGIAATGARVAVRRELDERSAERAILWEQPVDVPVARLPARAIVYSRDAATGTPLVAGLRDGRGAVLWIATGLGPKGFERFPYLLQSLADLGAPPMLVGSGVQAFLDWSYRSRADPAYLARRWRAMGVSTLHVSAWYFHERDAERDRYLRDLLDAAHRNGIVVYAWLELPHVSEAFWEQHPEWRERNGLLQDAAIYWRKNMNLLNEQAFAAVAAGVTDLLMRFDWDGANLSELYFEGPRGLSDPSEFTPLSDDVRAEVRGRYGFDPAELFRIGGESHFMRRADRLRQFYEYRRDLQYRLHVRVLDVLAGVRTRKDGSFGLAVCYLDDVFEPTMQDLIGADARRLLPLMEKYDFEFIIQDPSVLWGLGPDRYARMAERYAPLVPNAERLSVDVNVVARPSISFPTLHQTGTELFQLVNTVRRAFPTVTLYAENSILAPDQSLLPAAAAVATATASVDGSLTVSAPRGTGVRWEGPALVDGAPWPYQDARTVWLPAGTHAVAPGSTPPHTRLLDFNGTLGAVALTPNGLALGYTAKAVAIAILDRAPLRVTIDGRPAAPRTLKDGTRTVLLLPGGTHRVELITR